MVLALFDIMLVMLAIFKVISFLPFCIVIFLFFAFDFGGQICVDGKNEDFGYPGGIQGQLCANVECSIHIMKSWKYYVFVGLSFLKVYNIKCMLMSNC